MCGRYTLATPDPAAIRARFPVGEAVEIRRRFNVAPGDDVLAVTTDREGEPRGELLRWGLVPSWSESPETRLKMINARVETVRARPAFRRAFERWRCLIIADGFYEWQAPPSDSPGAPRFKRAFHITRPDGEPFAFAGLWSIWHGGPTIRSCTIITCEANPAISALHDRMPVILEPGAEAQWLDPATLPDRLTELLAPLPAAQTALRPVGPVVNDARYDGPECLLEATAEPVGAVTPGSLQATLF